MSFEPRISLITLGVADVAASTAFYHRLGFEPAPQSNAEVTFLPLQGVVLALFGADALAQDAGVAPGGGGFRGVALAYNVRAEEEVARMLAFAVEAGGRLLKPAQKAFWGGTSGYFADPDGHVWEIAHNPFFPMDESGALRLST